MSTESKHRESITGFLHETVPTSYIDVKGTKFAYRSFGKLGGIPLIFFIHFNGSMDNWDPEVTNPLSQDQHVILFDNRGVGLSEGEAAESVSQMADDAYAFINAMAFEQVNLLGFSLGGFVAQEIAAKYPRLVNKLILAGTSTVGGAGNTDILSHVQKAMKDGPEYILLNLFFSESLVSRSAGKEYLQRIQSRKNDRSPMDTNRTMSAQVKAITNYGASENNNFQQARSITQPTLIVNGNNDTMVSTKGSYDLLQNIPNSKLVIWSDSGHGALFQYHADFVREAIAFLN